MILTGLVKVLATAAFAVLWLLPTWTAPAAVLPGGVISSGMATLGGYAQHLNAWIDLSAVATCFTVITGALAAAGVIWVIRKVLDMIPYVNV